jgi:hypothetical protein
VRTLATFTQAYCEDVCIVLGAPARHSGGSHGGGASDGASSRHVPGSDAVPDWVVHHEREGEISEGGRRELRAPFVRGPAEGGSNCWTETDATKFNLRGPTYLSDSVKLPSKEPTHRPIGVNAFKTKAQLWHAVDAIPELREFVGAHADQQFVVITWLLPGTPAHSVVQLFVRRAGPDRIFDTLFQVGPALLVGVLVWMRGYPGLVWFGLVPPAVSRWR